ncbi:hypothetical protein HHI36_002284 [Cryptolaemus montrouzieri]|uniref:Uncharacterized protein n=1 Tax=Cryptolaemus montrouzieri TaxID=559131 RepID=A0ABD2PBH5_9CUCU
MEADSSEIRNKAVGKWSLKSYGKPRSSYFAALFFSITVRPLKDKVFQSSCSSSPSSSFNNDPSIEEYDFLLFIDSKPDNEPVTELKYLEPPCSLDGIQRDSVHHCGSQHPSAAAGCEQPDFFLNDADSTTTSPESINNEPTSPSSLLDEEKSPYKRSRKRKHAVNKCQWVRQEVKEKRLRGESYTGFRRKNKKKTEMPISQRGLACQTFRYLLENTGLGEEEIFSKFTCACATAEKKNQKRKNDRGEARKKSNRHVTYTYHLKVGIKFVRVCQTMFLNTFGIKNSTLRHWLKSYNDFGDDNQHKGQQQHDLRDEDIDDPTVETSRDQLEEPATPAHVPTDIVSMSQLYLLYTQDCANNHVESFSKFKFDKESQLANISIFTPKDQCDICFEFEKMNTSNGVYQTHLFLKDPSKDKALAGKRDIYAFRCDFIAIQL